MNANTIRGGARIALVALVLVLAAIAGLAVGNAIQDREGTLNAGYPIGYRGGAAVPAERAEAGYPIGYRGGAAVPAEQPELSDYHDRHADPVRQRPTVTDPKIR